MAFDRNIPFVGVFDVAAATTGGFPSSRANYKIIEKVVLNFGFERVAELTARDFWLTNIVTRPLSRSALRAWVRNYFSLSPLHRRLLLSKFRSGEWVACGWELSPGMKSALDENGIEYLDFRVSAFRFFDDLLIDIHTNSTRLMTEISERFDTVLEEELQAVAHEAKIDTSEEELLILAGQVPTDASVIGPKGGFVSLHDFASEIEQLQAAYGSILYRPHPRDSGDSAGFLARLSRDPEPSVYTHMMKGAAFCALSSSVLREAALFGCDVHRLMPSRDSFNPKTDRFSLERVHLIRSLDKRKHISGGRPSVLRLMFGQNSSDLRVFKGGGKGDLR